MAAAMDCSDETNTKKKEKRKDDEDSDSDDDDSDDDQKDQTKGKDQKKTKTKEQEEDEFIVALETGVALKAPILLFDWLGPGGDVLYHLIKLGAEWDEKKYRWRVQTIQAAMKCSAWISDGEQLQRIKKLQRTQTDVELRGKPTATKTAKLTKKEKDKLKAAKNCKTLTTLFAASAKSVAIRSSFDD